MTTSVESSPKPPTDQAAPGPSKGDKPARNTRVTAWHLGALLMAALGVWVLISLRTWHESFAASDEWAQVVLDKQLDGSVLLAAAARETPGSFSTEAGFKRALFDRINRSDSAAVKGAGGKELADYRALVARRGAIDDALRAQTTDADKRLQTRLDQLRSDIDSTLANDNQGTPEEVAKKRADTQRELTALNQQRQATVAVLKQMLADLDGQTDAAREGWQKAFEAALAAARPVDSVPARLWPWLAVRLGDETSAWHLLYVLSWYSIELLAALSLLIGIAPLLLRLAPGGVTPGEVKTTFMDAIGNLFKSGSPSRVAGGVVKAFAAVAMGTLAVNGVGLAAGNASPPLAPVVIHDPERGPVGPKGAPGEPGKPGQLGKAGERVTRERDKVEIFYVEGPDLRADLERLSKQVTASDQATRRMLTTRSAQILGKVQSTGRDVRGIHSVVGDLSTFERTSWEQDSTARGQLAGAVKQLDVKIETVNGDVGDVRKAMGSAADNVSVAAADVLRTNAKPGGVVANLNPRSRYRVDEAVIEAIKRAFPATATAAARDAVVDALRAVQTGRPNAQRIGQFRHDLSYAEGVRQSQQAQDLLHDLMPLILKVSRVPR